MQRRNDIASWSATGVVETLVVDDRAGVWTRRLNAMPRCGGVFHFAAAVELGQKRLWRMPHVRRSG